MSSKLSKNEAPVQLLNFSAELKIRLDKAIDRAQEFLEEPDNKWWLARRTMLSPIQ